MIEAIAFMFFIVFLYVIFRPLFIRKHAELSLEEIYKRIHELDGKEARNKEDAP